MQAICNLICIMNGYYYTHYFCHYTVYYKFLTRITAALRGSYALHICVQWFSVWLEGEETPLKLALTPGGPKLCDYYCHYCTIISLISASSSREVKGLKAGIPCSIGAGWRGFDPHQPPTHEACLLSAVGDLKWSLVLYHLLVQLLALLQKRIGLAFIEKRGQRHWWWSATTGD